MVKLVQHVLLVDINSKTFSIGLCRFVLENSGCENIFVFILLNFGCGGIENEKPKYNKE